MAVSCFLATGLSRCRLEPAKSGPSLLLLQRLPRWTGWGDRGGGLGAQEGRAEPTAAWWPFSRLPEYSTPKTGSWEVKSSRQMFPDFYILVTAVSEEEEDRKGLEEV